MHRIRQRDDFFGSQRDPASLVVRILVADKSDLRPIQRLQRRDQRVNLR